MGKSSRVLKQTAEIIFNKIKKTKENCAVILRKK